MFLYDKQLANIIFLAYNKGNKTPRGKPGRQHMKAILVSEDGAKTFDSVAELVSFMRRSGHPMVGIVGRGHWDQLRPELHGAPTFDGISGPSYGGHETPWRYETFSVAAELSR